MTFREKTPDPMQMRPGLTRTGTADALEEDPLHPLSTFRRGIAKVRPMLFGQRDLPPKVMRVMSIDKQVVKQLSMTWQAHVESWTQAHVEVMVALGCNQFAIQEDLLAWLLRNGPSVDLEAKENVMEILIRFPALSLHVVTSLLDIAAQESEDREKTTHNDTNCITASHVLEALDKGRLRKFCLSQLEQTHENDTDFLSKVIKLFGFCTRRNL